MKKVYLDNAATTALDKEVISVMKKSMEEDYGNPSSSHSFGRKSRSVIEISRRNIAKLLNADPSSLDQALLDYLEDDDNRDDASGFHIQTGLQFKLLMIDTFLIYRHTFVDDVIPGASSFGTLNMRLGLGI